MKKRLVSVISLLLILGTIFWNGAVTAEAEERENIAVDGSYLTIEESSTGQIESNPLLRGEHLMDGNSGISKAGIGRIYAYGATSANHDVELIAVLVFVDQYDEETDSWGQVAAWTAEDHDTYYVSTGKTLKVERGYYYRVHCDHYAGNEADYPYDHDVSFTNGIFID